MVQQMGEVLRGRPTILAIDDTPANLMVLASALSKEYALQLASSGAQGLEMAARNPPDLILLDIMMPEMDGYETCRRFKADPALAHIPIVFVTALNDAGSEVKGLELGASDYLYKPIHIVIARQRIRNLLVRKQIAAYEKFHRTMLELLVSGQPLPDMLLAIARGIEELHPGMQCRIALREPDGQHPAGDLAPAVPTQDDWTQPIRGTGAQELGTFSFRHQQPHPPTQADRIWMEQSAQLASIAIERSHAAEKLRESEAHFRMLSEDVSDVVWRTDAHLCITYISPSDQRLRGYAPEEVLGKHVFDMFTPEGQSTVRQIYEARLASESAGLQSGAICFEVQHLCKDGSLLWGEVQSKSLRDSNGKISGYHGITRETTQRRQLEDHVRQLAFYDPLTKLPNRRLLNDRLGQAMAASQRKENHGALLMLDLDNFKPLNDTHGHLVGDLLLVQAALRLLDCVREVDTVARFGGDEFVVLLCDLAADSAEATAQASAVAEKIRLTLCQPYVLNVLPSAPEQAEARVVHRSSASIGMVLFRGKNASPEELLQWADAAMYQAKDAGRNAFRLYEAAQPTVSQQPREQLADRS
jgi:diguanylate cyclase (GGDEF)-like protein/PAS domain S-box-containing protein